MLRCCGISRLCGVTHGGFEMSSKMSRACGIGHPIRRMRWRRATRRGFTLIEVMLGASIIAVVAVALIGGFLGESYLNMNARNTLAAMNDATRVMEQIRVQNIGTSCLIPSAVPPINPLTNQPYPSWNAWLNIQTPAKTIDSPNANASEKIVVTCQRDTGGTALADYCSSTASGPNPAQIGTAEWRDASGDVSGAVSSANSGRGRQDGPNTTFDPIRVTVSVGWAQRSRTVGGSGSGAEFTAVFSGKGATSPTVMPGPDANNNGTIDSQAMLTTLVTCR